MEALTVGAEALVHELPRGGQHRGAPQGLRGEAVLDGTHTQVR